MSSTSPPCFLLVSRNLDKVTSVAVELRVILGGNESQLYWSVDFVLGSASNDEDGNLRRINTSDLPLSPSRLFLEECIKFASEGTIPQEEQTNIRFIFSTKDGQIARSDFLERRLECCENVTKTVSFLSPLQSVTGVKPNQRLDASLLEILPVALGAVLLQHPGSRDSSSILHRLDQELENRLSFPWLISDPVPRRRVVWVQGREDFDSSRRAYEAAIALGISIVMIDQEGHWLQDDSGPYSTLREAFVPVSIDVDEGFTDRIVEAVREYPLPVDGLVTISDVRLPGVAKACEILGLPTSPYDAYAIAGDKAKTRMMEPDAKESFALSSAEELQEYLRKQDGEPLQFPLIVKPCIGWNSDCVSKVRNQAELVEAVRKASDRHADAAKRSTAVVVEPYIDGPEVDANLVLLDGQIIFFDISDDFPSNGDAEEAGHTDNFQETQNVIPTALPEREVAALRDSLHQSILRQGFSSGIFHCEARVRNSRVQYTDQNGIIDLAERIQTPAQEISVYLHEVNARPPGYLETVAVLLSYGVDYYALRLLLSIGAAEAPRIRALAQPFLNGPQFNMSLMIIQQDKRAGIMKTADAGAEFLARYTDLHKRIPDWRTQKKGGDILEGGSASSLWWVAYFSVFSRIGRRDLLQSVQFIQDNFSYEVDSIIK